MGTSDDRPTSATTAHTDLMAAAAAVPADAIPEGRRDPRLVIVDDQPTDIALLTQVLRRGGFTDVHAVTDAREAVARCLALDADLVLLDLQMPHLDGIEVMAALRSALPEDAFVPVLVLTSDTTSEVRDRVLRAGAKDFLTKPFECAEVVLRVRNLLESRSLYLELRRANAALRADLDQRLAEDRQREAEHRAVRERIDDVVSGDRIEMVFQPIADLVTGEVRAVEALARFRTEPRRPPNEWFAEATTAGRSIELEVAAVAAALVHLDRVPAQAALAVNVSPATAVHPALERMLAQVPGHRVVLELTEHTRIEDYETLLAGLLPLRERGIRIAVDDAGAGYAGLHHILRLRPDVLKLDIHLIRDIDTDPAKRALCSAMVRFAREIDAVIVAEGIETGAELRALRQLGVRCGQGYHLARPGPLSRPVGSLPLPVIAV